MLQRPAACSGCALNDKATGYAPPEGPRTSPILFQAEALGAVEAQHGRPLLGDAGSMFQRLLNQLGWSRDAFRISNTCQCRPPHDWLGGTPKAPWYYDAITHCAVHRDPVYAEGHKVVVPMGDTAIRQVLGLLHTKGVKVQDFHGTVQRDPTDRFWVVPTYHPSFLQRGAHNLIGTVLWDLQQAEKIAREGKPEETGSLVIDPPFEWFKAWVDMVVAMRSQDRDAYPISSDIETPDKISGKDEGELSGEDKSYQILRINVACHPDEGVTVPFAGPFIDELKRLHQSPGPIWGWNYYGYDLDRMIAAGQLTEADTHRIVDLMWFWHLLQSDLPRGLGFVAPFYSSWGPWKHIASGEPAKYGAIDGIQTHRVGFGIIGDLQRSGQLDVARRHISQLYAHALRPAQLSGVQIDRPRLTAFKLRLADYARDSLHALQELVPEDVCPLTPKGGLTAPPAVVLHPKATSFTNKGTPRAGRAPSEVKQELYTRARVIEKLVLKEIMVCTVCSEKEVIRKHRCKMPYTKKDGSTGWKPADYPSVLELQVATVTRWFWQEPFNPDSPPQVLAYLKAKKHTPGRAKKTHKDSTNRETLERLESKTKDPFYRHLLNYRAVVKVKGTYVEGAERRLDAEDRLHPTFTFKPSTQRLSCVNPNLQNVVADKEGQQSLAAGFRRCVVASAGCKLLEVDFNAIEAVQTGWLARDPDLIRLSKLSIHAGLASHILGKPYPKDAPEEELAAYLGAIKDEAGIVYDRAKRFIYGKLYGLTTHGMVLQLPHLFPTMAVAEQYERIFARDLAPSAARWQRETQELASRQRYLGGPGDHPYGYKHWFWAVHTFKRLNPAQYARLLVKAKAAGIEAPVTEINGQMFKISHGEDAKRALAFKPSSIAAGNLKEAMLRLFTPGSAGYIGDCKFGRTPLVSPIHDSLLLDIPLPVWDRVVPVVFREMQAPIKEQPLPESWGLGPYLSIGIGAKAGLNWAPYVSRELAEEKGIEINLEGMKKIPVQGYAALVDGFPQAIEVDDEDDFEDLGRQIA